MTPKHPRWNEFFDRLEGPEGCNFREEDGQLRFNCGGGADQSKAVTILHRMGFDGISIAQSQDYFNAHGGFCDCEILFNVDKGGGAK